MRAGVRAAYRLKGTGQGAEIIVVGAQMREFTAKPCACFAFPPWGETVRWTVSGPLAVDEVLKL